MKANFINLETEEQLNNLFDTSNEKPVVLYKHSTSCPISARAYRELENADIDVNLIIVQNSPEVSKAVETRTGIRHESPQVIVLRDGKMIYDASHYDITTEDITELAERD